jgi:PAS domain S-box-containing protein
LDNRFKKINRQLTEYALGNFKKKLRVSARLDEVDAFISCINMLGEELRETTISKNHFNNIFNSVSDMIFVLDDKGTIKNTSQSVDDILHQPAGKFKNKFIDTLETKRTHSLFAHLTKNIKKNKYPAEIETNFKSGTGQVIPVICTAAFLYNEKKIKIGYLVVAKDISNIKQYETSLKESEEKYRKIFEESSDCIFIADKAGTFLDINMAGNKLFKACQTPLVSLNLLALINKQAEKKQFLQEIKKNKTIANFAMQLKCLDKSVIDCLLSASIIEDASKKTIGYRGIIKDISLQKETEKLVLKTIVNTQEAERKRFAKDIHDSLGQQLSAIKFYIGTSAAGTRDEKQKNLLLKANAALITTLADMRNICFNLMPKTLENFGLVASVKELCKQTEVSEKLIFKIKAADNFPLLDKQLEISLFRVVQEFINNSIKHSSANKINIELLQKGNTAIIILKDNGKGFNMKSALKKNGMGLRNVQSRIVPYNGEIFITSTQGKGTQYKIIIPLITGNKTSND